MGSFHNVGGLFNTDISGGLPYIITQMLAYSEPGFISLLPALPKEWNNGKIEGLLLRGQAEIKNLEWSGNKIHVIILSKNNQSIKIQLPKNIAAVSVNGIKKAPGFFTANTFLIAFYKNKIVDLVIELE
ncbi:hypothetical protein GALL_127850 [mine drainage metagenome]|uniref:Alpha fucosidase A-like C-terminal domain-containing protein n=1 Tax=mine drainage metagenome TaxID=410659 RepID=A0A1J5S8X2_9ZZZZ